jgi:hypothetical protein
MWKHRDFHNGILIKKKMARTAGRYRDLRSKHAMSIINIGDLRHGENGKTRDIVPLQ